MGIIQKKLTTKVAVVHKWLSERYSLDDAYFKNIFIVKQIQTNLLYILTKIKSEKSTFVFKSLENKNHADKINYYQINK
jgi:hypothetical protein